MREVSRQARDNSGRVPNDSLLGRPHRRVLQSLLAIVGLLGCDVLVDCAVVLLHHHGLRCDQQRSR